MAIVMKSLDEALVEVVEICERCGISYGVMGGIAVRIHGIPRPTYDVDLTVVADQAALTSFFDAAEELGYEVSSMYRTGWRDRVADMPMVKLRAYLTEGHGIDVDVFLAESDFQASLMGRCKLQDFEQRQLNVVSPEDLILLKLLANRPRDLGDIGDVLFMQGQLDEAYLRLWAERLDIYDRLEKALETN